MCLRVCPLRIAAARGKGESSKELDVTDDYGDALLKAGKVTREDYDALQAHAKELIREYEKKEQAQHGK